MNFKKFLPGLCWYLDDRLPGSGQLAENDPRYPDTIVTVYILKQNHPCRTKIIIVLIEKYGTYFSTKFSSKKCLFGSRSPLFICIQSRSRNRTYHSTSFLHFYFIKPEPHHTLWQNLNPNLYPILDPSTCPNLTILRRGELSHHLKR